MTGVDVMLKPDDRVTVISDDVFDGCNGTVVRVENDVIVMLDDDDEEELAFTLNELRLIQSRSPFTTYGTTANVTLFTLWTTNT